MVHHLMRGLRGVPDAQKTTPKTDTICSSFSSRWVQGAGPPAGLRGGRQGCEEAEEGPVGASRGGAPERGEEFHRGVEFP